MTGSGGVFVVVGGGQAGAWIARTLRTEGFAGRIVLIGAEAHWPYERPPLSKAFLGPEGDAAAVRLLDEPQATALAIECWRGRRVTGIDRARHAVSCDDGRELVYDRLFLATGGVPRMPPWLDTAASPRVHALRTQDDAHRLRGALAAGERLLVLGGGWIGLEVAATARGKGLDVTVLEAGPRLCARTMPPVVSDYLRHLHAAAGVTVTTDAAVVGATLDPEGVTLLLAGGASLRGAHVLVGIGIVPDIALAVASGLAVDDGIVVDAQGRTSDPDIFAAGDVACHPNEFAGRRLRLESWANAQNQAIVAAKAALGRADQYADIPWFWSDQYDRNLQILGLPGEAAHVVARGTPGAGSGCWLMLRADGRVAGAVAVNAPRDLRALRAILAGGKTPDIAAWADPAIPAQRLAALAR